jgi:eukaryotic-like serine/threonine-protein kinase
VTSPTKIGRYEILDRIGRGGMGAVYRGRDAVLDREVAIKVMSADFAADDTSRPRFFREARAAARLQHRNIVTIFEFGEEDDSPFIVMEFLRGEDLARRVRRPPPLSVAEKIDIVSELCAGLQFAHEQGIIHRDVKPANVWLVPDGSVKLLDFGVAKFSSSTMTKEGAVFGSVAYMSPEQVQGRDVDGRADVFSAGVVLFELLAGKKPFTGDSPTAVLARILDDRPASAADLPADLPRLLVAAVMKSLEKNRDTRYRSAADMGADLRAVRSGLVSDAGGAGESSLDLSETMFADPGVVPGSGSVGPAGVIPVTRTATLEENARPPARPVLAWLLALAVVVAAGLGAGVWLMARAPGKADDRSAPTAAARPPAVPASAAESQPPGARSAVDAAEAGRATPAPVPPAVAAVVPAPPPPVAARPAAPAKAKLIVTGDYPFEVVEGGRVLSPLAESHEILVPAKARVYLRNPDYFLNHPVQLDGRPVFEWQAPALGRLQLTAGETCLVSIADRDLGEPPIVQTMAAGSYTAVVTCGTQAAKREPFVISPGVTTPVKVR